MLVIHTFELYTKEYSKIIQASSILEALRVFSATCNDSVIAIINVHYNNEFLR